MTRRVAAVVLGAVVLVVGVGFGTQALATPAPRPTYRAHRYIATPDQTSGLNAQGVPPGLGRRGTLHAELRRADRAHGAAVGSVELELQTTSTAYPSTILEIGTIQLSHGVLAVQGVQTENAASAPLAITGGTGHYVARRGTVTISDDGVVALRFVHH